MVSMLARVGSCSQSTLKESLSAQPNLDGRLTDCLTRLVVLGVLLRSSEGRFSIDWASGLSVGQILTDAKGRCVFRNEEGNEYPVSQRQARRVLPGDRVLCRLQQRGRSRSFAVAVVMVLAPAAALSLGHFEARPKGGVVTSNGHWQTKDVRILPGDTLGARTGRMVWVERLSHPFYENQVTGRIVKVIEDMGPVGRLIEGLIERHGLPIDAYELTPALLEAFDQKRLQPADPQRVDLTSLPFVTIDGENAKDFDDALYCRIDKDRFLLDVAIADVSFWVEAGDALDLDARTRGNSVYLADRVLPMLPERLSNDLCSLRPNEDRLAFICRMEINDQGEVVSSEFFEATICSVARLTYREVDLFLSGANESGACERRAVQENLRALESLSRSLLVRRHLRGSVDFEFPESKYRFDAQGWIDTCWTEPRGVSTHIVEEAMLAANICAAEALTHRVGSAGMYRIHEPPDPEDIRGLRKVLGLFGVKLSGGKAPSSRDLSHCLSTIRKKGEGFQGLQTLILRCMAQARYTAQPHAHFALGFAAYTHFTSPIRRYPDLIVHRLLKDRLGLSRLGSLALSERELEETAAHCSRTERAAESAERDAIASLKAQWMGKHLGEVFDAQISSVTSFGLFVTLRSVPIEGLVHISTLGEDFFEFDPVLLTLSGRRTGERFRLGDSISVKAAAADVDLARIDFIRNAKPTAVGRGRKKVRPRSR